MIENYESLQLALFLRGGPQFDAIKLWSLAFSESPSGFQTIAPGHTISQGIKDNDNVQIISQTGRIDILIQGPPPNPAQPKFVVLADINATINRGLAIVDILLNHVQVGRTACVIQGSNLSNSPEGAVLKMAEMLPMLPVPAETSDLHYQVLVTRDSKLVSGRRIRKVCRWQTAQMQMVTIDPVQGSSIVTQKHGAHTYIDVYSEHLELLDSKQSIECLIEVIDIAKGISTGGYDELR